MKKLVAVLVLVLALAAAAATPAFASVRVTARAKTQFAQGTPSKVVFTAKLTKRGHVKRGIVRFRIYRNGEFVRSIRAKRSGKSYKASWTLTDDARTLASTSSYRYKVRATTKRSGRGKASGRVTIPTPTPIVTPSDPTTDTTVPTVTPVPVPVPAPTTTPTATPGRWVGYYIPGCPSHLEPLDELQSKIGAKAAVLNFFIADSESFPAARVENAQSNGSIPMVTLEFHKTVDLRGVESITNGECDTYIRRFAQAAKANGGEIWLRPFHEMNGEWSAWCGVVGNNSAAKTVAAWKHIHDVFQQEGATNVKFVWNVNGLSCPNTSANAIEKYWPGDAYVDYTSIDGYNFGNHASWSSWASPESIFGDAYRRINKLSGKPMFIAEMACTSNGGDKAAWMANFFANVKTQFPKLVGVVWFNADKEEDWRVEETPATLAVMQNLAVTGY